MTDTRVREYRELFAESREALREGRSALAEANRDLRERYARARTRVEGVRRARDLLKADGPEADLRTLVLALDGRFTEWTLPPAPPGTGSRGRDAPSRPPVDPRSR